MGYCYFQRFFFENQIHMKLTIELYFLKMFVICRMRQFPMTSKEIQNEKFIALYTTFLYIFKKIKSQ